MRERFNAFAEIHIRQKASEIRRNSNEQTFEPKSLHSERESQEKREGEKKP